MIYVDSSVLLTIYLSQPRAQDARLLLGSAEAKVSSWLLAIEVPIVLRRSLGAREVALLGDALAAFDADLQGLHLYAGLPEIANRVRTDVRLAQCRALDAIHVASAMLVREESGQPLTLATFDCDQQRLAAACGLATLPT